MTAKIPEIKKLVEEWRTKILSGEYKVCDAFAADTPECVAVIAK
jgi:anti-sigma28 factor (negative regulator of flagellin synthesis)